MVWLEVDPRASRLYSKDSFEMESPVNCICCILLPRTIGAAEQHSRCCI